MLLLSTPGVHDCACSSMVELDSFLAAASDLVSSLSLRGLYLLALALSYTTFFLKAGRKPPLVVVSTAFSF